MCVSLSWWAVCRSLQPLRPQAPVPGVDAFPSAGQPMGFSVLQDPSGRQAGWGAHRSPGTVCVNYSLTHFWLFSKTWVQLLFFLSAGIVPA